MVKTVEQLQEEIALLKTRIARLESEGAEKPCAIDRSGDLMLASLAAEVCTALTRGGATAEVLQGCAHAVVNSMDAALVRIWTYVPENATLVKRASAGNHPDADKGPARIRLGEGHIGKIAREMKPYNTNDLPNDSGVSDSDWARREGIVSFAGYPLVHQGRLTGTMELYSKRPLSEDALAALSRVADDIAYSVEHRRVGEELSNFFGISNDMMCIAGLDGFYKRVNPAFLASSGYEEHELLSTPIIEFLHPDDRSASNACFVTLGEGKPLANFENRFMRKDGSYMNLLWNAVTGADGNMIYAIARDITSLRQSEDRFRSLVEDSPFGAFVYQDGRIVYCNRGLSTICGLSQDELLSMPDANAVFLPDDRPRLEAHARDLLEGNVAYAQANARAMRPDGNIVQLELYAWRTEYCSRPSITGTVLDVTDRIQVEKDRAAIMHMMTHDIKGPLTVIDGYCDILARELPEGTQKEMVAEIVRASGRISAFIRDMLDLSRIEAGKMEILPEPLDISGLIRRTFGERFVPAASMGVMVAMELAEGLPAVNADPRQIVRAVENLISNAVKFSRQNGTVLVETGVSDDQPGMVYIQVMDAGIGISNDDLPHVFEKYYRSRKTGSVIGTGLGLAIVKAIVESHCGKVGVQSEEGKGSTFRILLPVTGC